MALCKNFVLATLCAFFIAGCADSSGDSGEVNTDGWTHNTLDLVQDPLSLGCGTQPTAAFPRYGGGAGGTCSIQTMAAISDGIVDPLPEVLAAATDGSSLPGNCKAVGTGTTVGPDSEPVPAGCTFSYEATIGTVSAAHQVVSYHVLITESAGCWPETCEETIRVDYRESMIIRH